VSLAEEVGGEGSPGGTLLQKAGDAFPLLDALYLHRNTFFSNKFVGVDLRYRIPRVRGLQFYAEGVFDDFDIRRVRSVFTEDAGYVWGASMSCFAECGPVRATAEYHVTGLRFYTHGAFRSGFTVDNQFLGDQLGPRGKGGYGTVDVDRGEYSTRVDVAYEARSGNKYGSVTTTGDDSDFRFILMERNPTERRWRAMTSVRHGRPLTAVSYRVGGGVERVENFAHAGGSWRTNWLAQGSVEVRRQPRFGR
ncbi:MAG: capsule assembly Wzi family protein, partial [Gemmatimonadaceae bacterium]